MYMSFLPENNEWTDTFRKQTKLLQKQKGVYCNYCRYTGDPKKPFPKWLVEDEVVHVKLNIQLMFFFLACALVCRGRKGWSPNQKSLLSVY